MQLAMKLYTKLLSKGSNDVCDATQSNYNVEDDKASTQCCKITSTQKTLNYNDIFTLQNIINFRLSNALIIQVFTLSLSHKFCRNDV